MKNPILIFCSIILLIISFFSYSTLLYLNSEHRIYSEKIKKIKLGMSNQEVISILGKPINIEDTYLKDGKTYTYTKPIEYAMTYPMLWVHFNDKKEVRCVFAKKYILWGADDECIYAIDANYNPKNPDTSLFEANFK